MMDYHLRLVELGFDPQPTKPLATEADASRIEERVGVGLPPDYRRFLLSVGENWGCGELPFRETTPRGEDHEIMCFHSAGEVEDLLDSMITPRNMLTIGVGNFAAYTCLSICGLDRGYVYALDGEFRAYMNDEEFWERYPNLAPEIQEYLRIRAADELSAKPAGYENVYLLAESFEEFLIALRPCDDDSE